MHALWEDLLASRSSLTAGWRHFENVGVKLKVQKSMMALKQCSTTLEYSTVVQYSSGIELLVS